MRFRNVLTFDKKTEKVMFNISDLFKMRDVKSEDVEHLGMITRCSLLTKNGFLSSYLFKKDNTISCWTKSDLYIGKYKMDDFRIGCATIAPFAMVLSSAFLGVSWKTYVIIGGILYFI